MYQTSSGAKSHSKKLKKLLQASGINIRLHECQKIVAQAGGFRNWTEMLDGVASGDYRIEHREFRARFLAAVPEEGRSVVGAWLDTNPKLTASDRDGPQDE